MYHHPSRAAKTGRVVARDVSLLLVIVFNFIFHVTFSVSLISGAKNRLIANILVLQELHTSQLFLDR